MAKSSTTFAKGREKTGGRTRGKQNKTTEDIRALAQLHGPEAIGKLVELMRDADFETVQVAAAKEILDRAYGKSVQPVHGEMQTTISYELQLLFERTDRHKLRLPTEDERERVRNGNGTQH